MGSEPRRANLMMPRSRGEVAYCNGAGISRAEVVSELVEGAQRRLSG